MRSTALPFLLRTLGLAAYVAAAGILSPAKPALAAYAPPPADSATVAGASSPPDAGRMGVTETVSQIMERGRLADERAAANGGRIVHRKIELEADRDGLADNPDAMPVASYVAPEYLHEQSTRGPRLALAPQTVSTNFLGATLADTSAFPPDTMGAIGPTQFTVAVNGRIRTFNKTTGVADGALNVDMDTFFNSVMTPPVGTNFTSDPHIRYDRLTGRWFIVIIDVPGGAGTLANRMLLAVSSGPTISNASSFTFFFFQHNTVLPAGDTNDFADYPTLGVDANALYIGDNLFDLTSGSFAGCSGFVVQKSSILGAGPMVVNAFRGLVPNASSDGPYTPQGVDNVDPAATEGYFIGVSNLSFSLLQIRRVTNPGSASPSISANIPLTVPTTRLPITVPHLGNTAGTNGNLDGLDDRLFAAHIRNGRLWTAHNIQVNASGVGSTTGGRNGSRWYEIQNLTGTPSLVQSGTQFDSAATNPVSYFIPSVMVSGQGHAAFSFTSSGAAARANAATVGRLSGDALGTQQAAANYTASSFAYNPPSDPGGSSGRRWGDYSYVSLDPTDDMTMWSIAEFVNATNSYGVQVAKLLAPVPATPSSASPTSITQGASSVNVTITGTSTSGSGFFDPGANPAGNAFNHISASVSGTGVTVNSVTYNSPTSITLNLSATAGATVSARDITVTNPDGQSSTGTGVINVVAGAVNTAPVLDASKSPALAAQTEDAGAPSGAVGTLVSALVDLTTPAGGLDNVTDPDAGALTGIAINAADTTNGSWFYSTTNGASWSALGAVSDASARLLAADANTRVYFQPNANFDGTLATAITFRAWDQTSGTNGSTASAAVNGGATAFSTATDTASLAMTPVNDAPVLDASKSPALGFVAEDAGAPAGAVGTLVSSLVDFASPAGQVDNVTDVDTGALLGIAINAADTTNGSWFFSTNGGTAWSPLGAVSDASARLLAADANTRVYFQPNANFNGTLSTAITFRAWDQSTGANGSTASATPNGGTTAFSTASDSASLTVLPINDAPVLDASKSPTLASIAQGAGAPSGAVGTLVSSVVDFAVPSGQLDNVSDVDSGAVLGVAVVAADTTNGTWFYSIDNGATWPALGAVSAASSRLLAADANSRVYFQPNPAFNGTVASALTIRAWDQTSGASGGVASTASNGGTTAFSAATDTVAITVVAGNQAPTATNLSAAETYTEDTPLNLIDIVASDVDSPNITATLTLSTPTVGALSTGTSGAVTSTYNAGTGVWSASGAIADVNVLLAGVTFTPVLNGNSNFSMTTSVSDGSLSVNGSKAFTGTAVNDAPTATNLSAAESYTEDTPLDLIDIVASDVDSPNVTAQLSLSNVSAGSLSTGTSGAVTSTFSAGVWVASGPIANVNALLAGVTFTPAANFNASFTLTTDISDGAALTSGSKAFTGIAVNDAPTATNLSAGESYTEDTPLNLVDIVAGDVDNATVTATLTLSNTSAGALSTGTSGAVTSTFSAGTGVWSASGAIADVNVLLAGVTFTPAANFNASFTITTSVSDGALSATGSKAMTGIAVNDAPNATNLSSGESYTEDTPLNLVDIVASDVDGGSLTATLTLSNPSAGALSTGTSGAVTSTYSAGTGVWTASGAIANVNTLLAGVTFVPAANFNASFTIATSVSDGVAAAVTGTKNMTGIAVNDAPTGTNLSAPEIYVEDTPLNLTDIVASDVDNANVTATLTLSNAAAGSLSTGTSGTVTSTYSAGTGVWTVSGAIADVNVLLAGVIFTPAANFFGNVNIATSISDGLLSANGNKGLAGIAVNDAPTLAAIASPISLAVSAGLQTVNLTGIGSVEAGQSITVTATSDNPALIPNPTVTYTSPGATGSLSFTPVAAQTGTATITVTVQDSGGTANGGVDTITRTFTVNVLGDDLFKDDFE